MLVTAGLLYVGLSGTGLLLQAYFVGVLQVLLQQGIIRPSITNSEGGWHLWWRCGCCGLQLR
jgi:hypothetical protein